ncbi:60S ribosomal L30 [Micractinium conductrix]|uniref:60S ribosomal L30 n=1 Tax=Micractinium conductrix TaxID=554055 RepID=A0A2P6VJZ2_9CHLO|nr:60S ribosomal L30 [Micractinium conductrix]|eukprot:PSC74412.1 60S ribosomal L30 [Micractinium conductrix]
MVAAKKTKKAQESINSRLALVMKSGKYTLGYKTTLKTLRSGKAKLVIISNNCPSVRKSEIEYYAMLSKTGVHHYSGNNVDLGTACGKLHRVCVLTITDAGDSDIVSGTHASSPPAKQTLEGKVVVADTLFSKDYLFFVTLPSGHTCGEDNVEKLFEDLVSKQAGPNCTAPPPPISSLKTFALGTINLCEAPGGGAYTRKHVFDGQQRLISMFLLLSAVRDRLEAEIATMGSEHAGQRAELQSLADSLLSKVYQAGDSLNDRPDLPRIALRQPQDTEFLIQCLTDTSFVRRTDIKPENKSQTRLWNNMQLFRAQLKNMDVTQCTRLVKFVIQKVTFIVATSNDFELALNVYRSRHLCLSRCPKKSRWGATNDEFMDIQEVFQSAAKQLAPASTAGPRFMERLLVPLTKVYKELCTADFKRGAAGGASKRTSYLLRAFNRIVQPNEKTYGDELRPLALLLLLLHLEKRLSDNDLQESLLRLERLALRRPQPSRQHGTVAVPPSLSLSAEEKGSLLQALCGDIYKQSGSNPSRYILLRLNEFVLSRSGCDYVGSYEEKGTLTVEHVLPQTMREGSAWAGQYSKDAHAAWVDKAANLVLLSGERNTKASNKDFQEKKATYFGKKAMHGATNIPLTDEVVHCPTWTIADLEGRQARMLDLAKNCWVLY